MPTKPSLNLIFMPKSVHMRIAQNAPKITRKCGVYVLHLHEEVSKRDVVQPRSDATQLYTLDLIV